VWGGGGRGGGENTLDWTGNEAREGEGFTERVIYYVYTTGGGGNFFKT